MTTGTLFFITHAWEGTHTWLRGCWGLVHRGMLATSMDGLCFTRQLARFDASIVKLLLLLLLDAGSAVDIVDKKGDTPLSLALCKGKRGNAEALLTCGPHLARVKFAEGNLPAFLAWMSRVALRAVRRAGCFSSWRDARVATLAATVKGSLYYTAETLVAFATYPGYTCSSRLFLPAQRFILRIST